MAHPAIGEVGDVQQPVQTAQVHEDAVIGDVFDHPFHDLVLFQGGQEGGFGFVSLLLQQGSPGKDDVAPFAVEFQDLEVVALANEMVGMAHGRQVNLGAGQESDNASQVHGEAALDLGHDGALHFPIVVVGGTDLFPHLDLGGFILGEHERAFFIFPALHQGFHVLPHLGGDFPLGGGEFVDGDLAFGLVADVHHDVILGDGHDAAFDDFPFLDSPQALFVEFAHGFHIRHLGGGFRRG